MGDKKCPHAITYPVDRETVRRGRKVAYHFRTKCWDCGRVIFDTRTKGLN